MKIKELFFVFVFAMAVYAMSAMAQDPDGSTPIPAAETRTVSVLNNNGAEIGTLKITKASHGVLLNFDLKNLPAGYHGMHFHEMGDCSDMETFKTAGGHIMPDKKPHGFLNSDGPHEGNLPNLIVAQDGTVQVELYSNLVQFDDGAAALYDDNGSAIIIHTDPDDHMTQPIGGAGGRIACGVIK